MAKSTISQKLPKIREIPANFIFSCGGRGEKPQGTQAELAGRDELALLILAEDGWGDLGGRRLSWRVEMGLASVVLVQEGRKRSGGDTEGEGGRLDRTKIKQPHAQRVGKIVKGPVEATIQAQLEARPQAQLEARPHSVSA